MFEITMKIHFTPAELSVVADTFDLCLAIA